MWSEGGVYLIFLFYLDLMGAACPIATPFGAHMAITVLRFGVLTLNFEAQFLECQSGARFSAEVRKVSFFPTV